MFIKEKRLYVLNKIGENDGTCYYSGKKAKK
jgi:hypothetical protein